MGDFKPVQDAQFNLEKWKEMADILKETDAVVLTNKKDSKYVPSASIKTRMLEGPGQVVEVIKKDDKTRYFVLIHMKSDKMQPGRSPFCILTAGEE